MNKTELVASVAEATSLSKKDAENAVSAVIASITKSLTEGEKVQIMDINNGERFETYIIKGERGSGAICLNGAAARKVQVGDVVIIASYALMDFEDAKAFRPWIVFPDTETNRLIR